MKPEFRQAKWRTPVLFERHSTDAHDEYFSVPSNVPPASELAPPALARSAPVGLPTLGATDVTRHYTRLSQKNVGVDTSFYPLGSCTMKLNPKLNDEIATTAESTELHPLVGDDLSQGSLQSVWELQEVLKEISGMDAVTLQPAAGAQGEWTSMLLTSAYFSARGETRDEVIVPDNAHGTNPASAAMAGYKVLEIPSTPDGGVDLDALKAALSPRTAAFMITNPSTLGIFEANVREIARLVHDAGALLYYDGANLNAIMGVTTPGAMGFDMVHINLHKTLTIPHGGGGPGAGPVGVKTRLAPFLPVPVVERRNDGTFVANYDRPQSIGKVKSFHGNFVGYVRSLVYAKMMGGDGLTEATHRAVLNAQYLRKRIEDAGVFGTPYAKPSKHEFVISATRLKSERGVRALDVAKRLLDYGYHAPTVYFPLIVDEAIMIEPTETESKETLDRFVEALVAVAREDPEVLHAAPHNTSIGRVDEVRAAKEPRVTFDMVPKRR